MGMVRFRAACVAASAVFTLAAAGCDATTQAGAPSGKMPVVVAFYPLQYVTEQVGGDRVTVTNLVKPGAEPHDLELQPKQMSDLGNAKLVVYLRSFQPSVDTAVDDQAKGKALDTATVQPLSDAPAGSDLHGKDPHIWLDPTRLAAVAEKVADRLATLDTAHAADFRSRAAALRTKLEALDKEYAAGLANCQRHEIVTSHAAFGYLAARYKLTQIPITGLSPEEEPTPQHLADVAAKAKETRTTTIFFETLVSPKVAETLAKEVGAKAQVLDPIEGIEPGSSDDYVSVMRSNLTTLRSALACS
jgi:zinc transport system substrate-binding protein